MRKVILCILLIIWMLIIFLFSCENADESENISRNVTTRTTNLIYRIFDKDMINDELIVKYDPLVRKVAHVFEYFILTLLFSLFIENYNFNIKKILLLSFIFSYLYACSDEIHQLFVDGRSGSLIDTFIDSMGIFMWLAIYYLKYRCYNVRGDAKCLKA